MVRKRVGILVFAEVEVLDFCGPFEVFSATRLTRALHTNIKLLLGCIHHLSVGKSDAK